MGRSEVVGVGCICPFVCVWVTGVLVPDKANTRSAGPVFSYNRQKSGPGMVELSHVFLLP